MTAARHVAAPNRRGSPTDAVYTRLLRSAEIQLLADGLVGQDGDRQRAMDLELRVAELHRVSAGRQLEAERRWPFIDPVDAHVAPGAGGDHQHAVALRRRLFRLG